MVTRKKLIAERFLSGSQPTAQPQQARVGDHTPPPLPSGHAKKKQRLTEQQTVVLTNVVMKSPPRVSTGIVIQEPVGVLWPTPQTDVDEASFSQLKEGWQPTLKLGDGPLLASASVSAWSHGQGG